MTNIGERLRDVFRNLKSDAVPRPARTNIPSNETTEVGDDNVNLSDDLEDIVIESDDCKKEKKSKKKKTFFKTKNDSTHSPKKEKSKKRDNTDSKSNVNTQATGNVINIVNASDVRWGNKYVYYMGPSNQQENQNYKQDEQIEKDNLVTLLMEATIKPEHEYIDYISKNLGKNWHSFFKALGYTKGRIETMEIDEARNGVSEARYKLLLDWKRNDSNGSLGQLAKVLWEEGERQIVKELSLIYKKNKG